MSANVKNLQQLNLLFQGKQITTLTRANRKLAHNMFMEAAELGYIPAKERVAWSQLLGSNSLEELPIAKSTLSQHLNELKDAGLIQGDITPPTVKYCINRENWKQAKKLLNEVLK